MRLSLQQSAQVRQALGLGPTASAADIVAGLRTALQGRGSGAPSMTRWVSPAVASVARELGVDTHSLTGTGAGGRVSLADVRAAARPTRAVVPAPAPPRAQTLAEVLTSSTYRNWS